MLIHSSQDPFHSPVIKTLLTFSAAGIRFVNVCCVILTESESTFGSCVLFETNRTPRFGLMLNRASRAFPEVHDEASAQTKVIKKMFDLREVLSEGVDRGSRHHFRESRIRFFHDLSRPIKKLEKCIFLT